MIQEGEYIESEFGLGKAFLRDGRHSVFDIEILIENYDKKGLNAHSFPEDLIDSIVKFKKAFSFLNFTEMWLNNELFFIEKSWFKSDENIDMSKIFGNYNKEKLKSIFNDDLGEHIINLSTIMPFKTVEMQDSEINSESTGVILFDNRNEKIQLILSFEWNFGAEWFYNKYKEENIAIVRKAIIDFYESNPNYKELKIDYQLYGFDLELEKYTSKEVIVKKNLG
ncbi:hypothetical protein [Emticicia sp. W12TSBA100-4]|uniref:hypothetical protein n=1 Tax=Emticicia sp. W12TSBA100-4 TaxID=3160965 RepID=UPI0033062E7F